MVEKIRQQTTKGSVLLCLWLLIVRYIENSVVICGRHFAVMFCDCWVAVIAIQLRLSVRKKVRTV